MSEISPAHDVVLDDPGRDGCRFPERIMPIYLVRTIDEHDLVGIFVAPNLLALAMLVDECTDPGDCEYQRMKPGGIMWTRKKNPPP
jgi:hypothetical protein